ncbi:MAG: 2-oxoacid:acceptor oxidoreductase subunit alpha [Candidatus Adiutrix sp.]|jgi:2-oxoglutarate ferredoxin oxidoreductase subunit alpha|nr:2-oxoacid:acceptor oxidoreductase subunit alpha [Candidatus Adiutrix sp.]
MRDSLTIVIGGEAGQGLATVGELLSRILTRAGHNFLTFQGYHSRIRGGHNTFALKISPAPLAGPEDGADLVLSLNEETDVADSPRLRPGGLLLACGPDARAPEGVAALPVPYAELSAPREQNLVALGLLTAALALPLAEAAEEVDRLFKDKGGDKPLAAFKSGYYWAEDKISGQYAVSPAAPGHPPRLVINGNEALALGAAAGGVNFCSFYPMSPATTVSLSLADWAAQAGLVVEQAEDEIAAINMALGAAYGGASALVGTSGGGFALMCEGVSLAAMIETPVVIAIVQRPGPATGLPTRTEQGDLNLALYSGHGEFPRAILAPSSTEECFTLAARAAHLAEESQGPVFILSDQFLADCTRPVPPFDFAALPPPVDTAEAHRVAETALQPGQPYQRYRDDLPGGLSPRLLPGFSDHLVPADSDEHDADGHLTEDLAWRVRMQDKRMRKMGALREQALAPDYQGDGQPDVLLVSWGSTKGAALEALNLLAGRGEKAALLHFNQLYPLRPEDWLPRLEAARRVVFVEGNATGQFAQLVRGECGFAPAQCVLRYDGLPLTAAYILDALEVPHA